MSDRWTRRAFLRAAGITSGAAALLPFMPTLAHAAGTPAKRLITFTMPMTNFRREWSSNGAGAAFVNGAALPTLQGPMLSQLDAHRSKLVILDGVDLTTSNLLYGVQPQPVGAPIANMGHFVLPTVWTGTPARATTPQSYSDIMEGYANVQTNDITASGWSIDQAVHARLKQSAPHLQSLQLNAHGGWANLATGENCVSFGAPQTPGGLAPTLYPKSSPQAVFDQLFGSVQQQPADPRNRRRGSVLDVVRGHMNRLKRELPTEDRLRLEQHHQGIVDLEARLAANAGAMACAVPQRPGATDVSYGGALISGVDDPRGNARVLFELVRLAFECDLVRCVSFMCGTEGEGLEPQRWDPTLRAAPVPGDNSVHSLSHQHDFNPYAAEAMRAHNRSMVGCLVDLVNTLERGANTMSQTLIAASGTMYDTNQHTSRIPPCLLVAGDQTPIRRNQYRRFTPNLDIPYGNRNGSIDHNRVLTTIGQAMGLSDMTTFGYVGTYNFSYGTGADTGAPIDHTPLAEVLA